MSLIFMVRKKRTIISVTNDNYSDYKNNAKLLYVLDEDPVKASRSLVRKHLVTHANMIAETLTFQYLNIIEGKDLENLRSNYHLHTIPFICRNAYSINFFSIMFEELNKIYLALTNHNINTPFKFKEDLMLFNVDLASHKNDKSSKIYFPNYLDYIKNSRRKGYKKYNIKGIDNPNNSDIDLQRLMYIIDGYALSDFPCGAPEWYSPMTREIYRKYDRVSKKTFIIQVDEQGKYRYYFQHISNRLREITDISDLRELIDSLLYRV